MFDDVLVATLGERAQVVTFTYRLLVLKGFRIARVVVPHTSHPVVLAAVDQTRFVLSTINPALKLDFNPIYDDTGTPIEDVVTAEQVIATWRALFDTLSDLKNGPAAARMRIQLGLAGGRKTMPIYAMLAAQKLFDPDDGIWNLVTRPEYYDLPAEHPVNELQAQLLEIPRTPWNSEAELPPYMRSLHR